MLTQLLQVLQNLGQMCVEPLVVALIVVVIATVAMYWRPRSPSPCSEWWWPLS